MPKIYTKTGDKGTTSLYDMSRVEKSNIIFDVLGDIDELSCYIGLLCSVLKSDDVNFLRFIQHKLLDIGSDIATLSKRDKIVEVSLDDVKELEQKIDYYSDLKEPLKEFILVGYGIEDSYSHLCRAIARKAERNLWKIKDYISTGENTFIYMNRLSDFFFVLARYLSRDEITRSTFVK